MKTDKDIALELIDAIEEMYYREIVHETLLENLTGPDAPPAPANWREHFERAMKNQENRKRIHEHFSPLREQVLHAPDLTSAVREMLEGLERIDPENSGSQ